MKSIVFTTLLTLSLLFSFSFNCIAEDAQQLGIDRVCAEKYLDANTKLLCSDELVDKARSVNTKFVLHASSLKNYEQLKKLNLAVLMFNSGWSICNFSENEKFIGCVGKELDKASANIDVQNLESVKTDINSLHGADLTKLAKENVVMIVDSKLKELNVCRIAYVNKLDDNISDASDVSSAVQNKCNYLAIEFYEYSLLNNLSSAYDMFEKDYMDFATKIMFVKKAVEKHFGQQATTALVLEQRASRKANVTKSKKSKTDKKINI